MKATSDKPDAAARRTIEVRPEAWRLYAGVLAPALVVIALMAMLAITSVNVLGALRAYVGGESLWSKARSDAVQHLRDFAVTRNAGDYAAFEDALALPMGDQRAREEMMRNPFSERVVRDGLIAGGNHPDDIDGMVTLFRRFGDQPAMKDALAAWIQGDMLLGKLHAAGNRLREQVTGSDGAINGVVVLKEVRALNDELVVNEKRFSASLADLSRLTEKILVGSTVSLALVLSLLGFFLMRWTLMRQAAHRQALASANEPWVLAAAAAELGFFQMGLGDDHLQLDARAAEVYGLGCEKTNLPRTEMRNIIVSEDVTRVQRAFLLAMQTGEVFKANFRVKLPDGSLRHVESTGHRLDDGDAGGKRLVGVVRDVTEAHDQAQRALQRDAAEKVAQTQRDFLSRLSHELRTPLNAILGFAQLLLLDRTQPLTPSQAQRVTMMMDAGQQLLSMIEDVLDLSKVDAGEIAIALQPVELSALWRASVALLEGVRERHGITFIDRLSGQPLWVLADPQRLTQVFVNLLTNGCKYNHPGGHVVIEGYMESDTVVIDFSDDGIGMSPEQLAQLFQPFKRVAPQAESIEGTGLGLYIVRQLIERMNGSVSVSSEVGRGSRFTLRLPATHVPV